MKTYLLSKKKRGNPKYIYCVFSLFELSIFDEVFQKVVANEEFFEGLLEIVKVKKREVKNSDFSHCCLMNKKLETLDTTLSKQTTFFS